MRRKMGWQALGIGTKKVSFWIIQRHHKHPLSWGGENSDISVNRWAFCLDYWTSSTWQGGGVAIFIRPASKVHQKLGTTLQGQRSGRAKIRKSKSPWMIKVGILQISLWHCVNYSQTTVRNLLENQAALQHRASFFSTCMAEDVDNHPFLWQPYGYLPLWWKIKAGPSLC